MNSTRSRWSIYGPRQMLATNKLRAAAENIEKAKRAKVRAECELWNVNMEGFGGPAQPSPTINQALGSGFMFLQVKCPRCSSLASVNLQEVRRHGGTDLAAGAVPALSEMQDCDPLSAARPPDQADRDGGV